MKRIILGGEYNQLVHLIYRMPVILSQEAEAIWLDPAIDNPARLLPLLIPYPAEEMEAYPVSVKVNNPEYDGPECVQYLHGSRT